MTAEQPAAGPCAGAERAIALGRSVNGGSDPGAPSVRSRWAGRRPRLFPGGLRWRLAAWVAGVVVVSSVATFAVVYLGTSAVGSSDRDIEGDVHAFLLAVGLTFAGALIGAFVIGTRFSRPLQRMAAVAQRVDAGDLHPRIHHDGGPDELRVLADAFNHMLDRLTEAFAGQLAFVADASHELRTPLTVIRGQLEVLAAQEHPSEREVRRVERLVAAEIARVGRLVDDLLLLARAEQTEFLRVEEIDLGDYVQGLWDGMSLLADRRFILEPVPEGVLAADPDRLAQALRNLVANAIDHTSPHVGIVRLRVLARAGGRVAFVVEDDGPGIPLEQRERVFDRFHRTDAARDRASGGTGLGLAIVRAIAEAHGGRVSAATGREDGARMELELPAFTPAPRSTSVGLHQ
jgi:two-component system, OmpR family, sensor kinase